MRNYYSLKNKMKAVYNSTEKDLNTALRLYGQTLTTDWNLMDTFFRHQNNN